MTWVVRRGGSAAVGVGRLSVLVAWFRGCGWRAAAGLVGTGRTVLEDGWREVCGMNGLSEAEGVSGLVWSATAIDFEAAGANPFPQ